MWITPKNGLNTRRIDVHNFLKSQEKPGDNFGDIHRDIVDKKLSTIYPHKIHDRLCITC